MPKIMNHEEYPKSLESKTYEEILFIINDAQEAIEAMPDNPNNGYYADEINYCVNELHKRDNRS